MWVVIGLVELACTIEMSAGMCVHAGVDCSVRDRHWEPQSRNPAAVSQLMT
jgi:hypothetical protein